MGFNKIGFEQNLTQGKKTVADTSVFGIFTAILLHDMIKNISALLSGIFLILLAGCMEDADPKVPVLETTTVYNIGFNIATTGGTIAADGGASVTARGVCWSTSPNPEVTDSKTVDGTGKGNFVSQLTGLTAAETYYLRAYAVNSAGTAYGDEVTFTAAIPVAPSVSTASTFAAKATAASGGTVTNDGGAPVTARGICWSTNPDPTIAGSKTVNGTGIGTFTSVIANLDADTEYYARAYATNSAGTSYGANFHFFTLSEGNDYSGIYEIAGGSIYRELVTGPDPVFGGDYIVGTVMYIGFVDINTVSITLLWANNTVVGSIAPVTLEIDPMVTLPDGSHPVTISSPLNGTLTNSPSTDNKFFPVDGSTPQEFLLNFEWYGTGLPRIVTDFNLRLIGE